MANFLLIRDLCEKNNISLAELSSRTGMTCSNIQKIMSSGTTKTKTIEKIAKALNVPVGYFFDEPTASSIIQTDNAIGKNKVQGHTVQGDGNKVSGNVSLNECHKEIEHLKELLAEKERLIQVLMKEK
jgi:transcriptional regulator with XRE-family HTH domain